MNNCMFSGRVVRKPVRKTQKRKSDNEMFTVVKFSLAVEDIHDEGTVVFPEFQIMGRQAEVFADKVPKGTRIYITRSSLKMDTYHVDGEKVTKFFYRVHEWEFAESKAVNDAIRKKESQGGEDDGYGDDGLFDEDDEYGDDRYEDDDMDDVESQLKKKNLARMNTGRNALKQTLPKLPKVGAKLWNGFTKEEIRAYMNEGYSKEQLKAIETKMMATEEGQKRMLALRMQSMGFTPAGADNPF